MLIFQYIFNNFHTRHTESKTDQLKLNEFQTEFLHSYFNL
jgi:hypothetical protein